MYYTSHYVIDWDKVQSLDDVKEILKVFKPTFEPYAEIENIKHMLRLEKKPKVQITMD